MIIGYFDRIGKRDAIFDVEALNYAVGEGRHDVVTFLLDRGWPLTPSTGEAWHMLSTHANAPEDCLLRLAALQGNDGEAMVDTLVGHARGDEICRHQHALVFAAATLSLPVARKLLDAGVPLTEDVRRYAPHDQPEWPAFEAWLNKHHCPPAAHAPWLTERPRPATHVLNLPANNEDVPFQPEHLRTAACGRLADVHARARYRPAHWFLGF
jgi:hypothetical protein